MVLLYWSWLTFQILKRLISVAHIALVNLIAGYRLVPELIQQNCTAHKIAEEVGSILKNPQKYEELQSNLQALRKGLGKPGVAGRVAEEIKTYLP